MTTLDDDAWDDLLRFIEERRVIPIVGPELLRVDTDRGPGRRASLLKETAALIDAAPPALRELRDIRLWRGLIRAAQRGV